MLKILVTGADGMLGSNLVRMLLENEHDVSVFLFDRSNSNSLDGLNIKKYYGDITIPDTLDDAVKSTDVIIHVAASTSVWPSRSEMLCKINVTGTQNIICKTLEHNVKKLIYIGSASSVNTELKFDASQKYSFPGAKFKLDYIDSKYYALQLILKSITENNLPATAILPTFMIGAYDSAPGSGKLILNLASGKLKFYTGGGRNFVHVKDVANAIVNSLNTETNGKVYIIGNENMTYREFFNLAAKIIGKPEPKIKIPDWCAKTYGFIGELLSKIIHFEPLLSYPMARIACEKQFIEGDSAKELNIIKTPIKIAIEESYNWFLNNHYIQVK
ncbi:NAD-dependent epimerase/dehydratase family protein [Maribellus comscasis]|uniref:NAD-dependent epimerase/dehydratase family protein n=1 Tax=Maribellus comscasis TaxID=2681766 RepID=A0A6I6K2Z2_9BACT|nr:NAD-dependent epimerase/dehydratase family protein [Maribellus comscasis]QGY44284.1 NAD-dependent epimerase/dehydratase family protein [Maribellus comscasis]